jgi:hypothetical protein
VGSPLFPVTKGDMDIMMTLPNAGATGSERVAKIIFSHGRV